jgi:hypothetical protein
MPKRKNPIVNPPSAKPELAAYADKARDAVTKRLARIDHSWYWLALQVEENGIASRASVLHYSYGRQAQIGCAIYLAILDILTKAERRHKSAGRGIRIRAGGAA